MKLLQILFPLIFLVLPVVAALAANETEAEAETTPPTETEAPGDGDEDGDIEDGAEYQKFGERCGNHHPCEEGLDCFPAPILKRCYPVRCFLQAVTTAQNETDYDIATYGNDMARMADVTPESDFFRSYPGRDMSLINTNSTRMANLLRAIRDHPPPLSLIVNSFQDCIGDKASVPGFTPYFGMSWGIGALGTYNGDLYWAQGSNDATQVAVLNNCFGFILGYDLGFSGLLGMAFTGTAADLQTGCKQMFPVFEFPPFSLEVGFQDCNNPTALIELTLGLSAGASLPGYTTCTTTSL